MADSSELEDDQSLYSVEITNVKLVHAIKKRPCLYNTSLPEYTKAPIKSAAWQDVSKDVGCSVDECKRRWKNMRTVYRRELGLVQAMKKKKPYYLVEHMQFILPHMVTSPPQRRKVRNTDKEMIDFSKFEESIEDESYDESSCSSPDSPDYSPHSDIHLSHEHFDYAALPMEVQLDESINNEIYDTTAIKQEIDSDDAAMHNSELVNNIANAANRRTLQPVIIQYVKAQDQTSASPSHASANLENPRRQFTLSLLPEIREMTEKQFRTFKRRMLLMIDDVSRESE